MPSLTTYKLLKQEHNARRGEFKTVHGTVQTPAFQNVATAGAIKGGLSAHDLKDIGAQVMLCNTYHLHLRPGDKLVAEMGGLHKFTRWNGPILTDSGGVGILLHVVVIAQLTLGLDILGNSNNAVSVNGSLRLNYIKGDGNDLTILIEGSLANSNISLSLGGILILGISAAHGNNHAQTSLVGGSGGLGIRSRSGIIAAGYQRKSHHRNQKHCNKLFHFLFLLRKVCIVLFFVRYLIIILFYKLFRKMPIIFLLKCCIF